MTLLGVLRITLTLTAIALLALGATCVVAPQYAPRRALWILFVGWLINFGLLNYLHP